MQNNENNYIFQNEIVFKISDPYFKELLEKIPREISSILKIKEENKKYGSFKLKGSPKEIVEKLIEFMKEKLKNKELITDIKVNKIKRIWNSNDLVINFEFLSTNLNRPLYLELLNSEKTKNYNVEIKLKF
jgi:anaerobic ribonucleoside-triphosphate reductase